jgi:hypothetical protein
MPRNQGIDPRQGHEHRFAQPQIAGLDLRQRRWGLLRRRFQSRYGVFNSLQCHINPRKVLCDNTVQSR